MVGWANQIPSSQEVSGWGGNLVVQKLVQKKTPDSFSFG